jgi:hypothetical protein
MSVQDPLPLFPLRIASTLPNPWASADLKELARTADGHDFAVKWEHDGAGLPASEWLGHKLAVACQIATHYTATLTDAQGRLGFGSRIESHAASFKDLSQPERAQVVADCGQAMSAVLALDLFIGNEDRHLNNWLFRHNQSGQWTPLCIDFSRALFRRGFPGDPWPLTLCNTTNTQGLLKRLNNWDGPYAVFAIEQLQRVTSAVLEHWLADCPAQWLNAQDRKTLLTWWGSQAYHLRIQQLYALL